MKTRIGMLIGALVTLTVLSLGFASAQEQQPRPPQPRQEQQQPPPPPNDPVGEALFPPELVMQHQRELGLTDEQKTFMRSEIQSTTTRFNELQWQLQDAVEALGASMKESSVNEQQALAQLDKVLDAEREIKRLHIGLAIRIKNKLTPDQQEKLQTMKRHEGGPGRGPGGPGGPGRGPGGGGPGGPPGGPGGPGGPGHPGGPGGPPPGAPGRPGDEQPPPEPPTQ